MVFFIFKEIISANNDNTYINSSNIIYDEKNNTVEFANDSKINIGETNLLIDKGIIDYKNNLIRVDGNFYLHQKFNILSGNNLKGNTDLTYFEAKDISYIYDNDLKIDSKRIEKLNDRIFFYDNFITPCDLEGYFNCPTWALRVNKTEYDNTRDQFFHYDSFVQIADFKVLYLPYFSHFGSKAPRQKGFLTPSLEYNLAGNFSLKTPYYLPLSQSMDLTFSPLFQFSPENFLISDIKLNTLVNFKNSSGNTTIDVDNFKIQGEENIFSDVRFTTEQIINQNSKFSAKGLITNSTSGSRSINDEPIKYDDIFFRLEQYNLFKKNDYLRSELSSVKSFDTVNEGQIPIIPTIKYYNTLKINKKIDLQNNLNLIVIKRNSSTDESPNEALLFNLDNKFVNYNFFKDFDVYNEYTLITNLNNYTFEHDNNLSKESKVINSNISSDFRLKVSNYLIPRIKFIHNQEIYSSSFIANEDSNSITFNYENMFSNNRLFGNSLIDNSTRFIYGLENDFQKVGTFKIGQMYDFNKNSNYLNEINQSGNLSDYAIEFSSGIKNVDFYMNSRLSHKTLAKKEMNYSLSISNPVSLVLSYSETNDSAFKRSTKDSKSLNISFEEKIKDNFKIAYSTNLDLKNNYSPYYESYTLSLFDGCSQLDLSYITSNYSDNLNTKPNEKITLNFYMDYLGYMGYEQKTNLFVD